MTEGLVMIHVYKSLTLLWTLTHHTQGSRGARLYIDICIIWWIYDRMTNATNPLWKAVFVNRHKLDIRVMIILYHLTLLQTCTLHSPPPPPPHLRRFRGYLCLFPTIGKKPFYGLFQISTPFLGNFSQLTPYLGNIMVTPIPLFYFIFFWLGKYVSVLYHYPRGALQHMQWGPYPLFSGGYWRLGKHVRINHTSLFLISREASEKHPISWEIRLKTPPFPYFQDKWPKNTPFPEKMRIRMRPLCTFTWGGGWVAQSLTYMYTHNAWTHYKLNKFLAYFKR